MPTVSPEMQRARQLATDLATPHVSLVLLATPAQQSMMYRGVLRGSDSDLVAFGDMVHTVGEGPAHDVLRTGRACVVDDLTDTRRRWPLLTSTYPMPPQLRRMLVLPLTPGTHGHPEDVVGVLVLARPGPPYTAVDAYPAGETAAQVTLLLLDRVTVDDDELADAVDDLVDPRTAVLPQAVGLLSQTSGLPVADAERQLNTRAFLNGTTLHDEAEQVLHAGRST